MQFPVLDPRAAVLSKKVGQVLRTTLILHNLESAAITVNSTSDQPPSCDLKISADIVRGAIASVDFSSAPKLVLMFNQDEEEFGNSQSSTEAPEEGRVPDFKRSKADQGHTDGDLLDVDSDDIITLFPEHVRKILTWPCLTGDKMLSLSTIARNRLYPPRQGDTIDGVARRFQHTMWRARVFLWHLEQKGIGKVVELYPNRRPKDKRPYFLTTPWCRLSEELREELQLNEFESLEPISEALYSRSLVNGQND